MNSFASTKILTLTVASHSSSLFLLSWIQLTPPFLFLFLSFLSPKARDPPITVAVLESDRIIFHDPSFQG